MGIDGLTPADRFFGRGDQVLARIDAISRQRQGAAALVAPPGAPVEEVLDARSSRLCSRALGPFGTILDGLVRRGRPARKPPGDTEELKLTGALLSVTTALLAGMSCARPGLRELVVGAWLRLQREAPALRQQ